MKWRLGIRFKHKINKADKKILSMKDEDLSDDELERKMELEDILEPEESENGQDGRDEGDAEQADEPG